MFEGHFPGYPILPGVLMIETMAQTGGWLVLATLGCAKMPFLIQVEKAKMRSLRRPGPGAGGRGEPAARRLRLRGGEGQHRGGRQEGGGGRDPLRGRAVPERDAAGGDAGNRRAASACPRNSCHGGTQDDADRDALITGIGIVSCLGSGADAHWAALNAFTPVVDTDSFRPVPGASAGAAGPGQADPQARRPAADGGLAAHRRVRRRPGAGLRRGQGQRRAAVADGHDRRGRRRGARLRGRRGDPVRLSEGRRTRVPI